MMKTRRWLPLLFLALLWVAPAQAAVFFDDSFEGTYPEDSGWTYTPSTCQSGPACLAAGLLYNSTDVAHSGSKSLKGLYSAAWSDPNPQINEAAIYRSIPPSTDLYIRMWYRTHGFTYGTAGTKHLYPSGDFGGGWAEYFSINWFGSREMSGLMPQGCTTGGECHMLPNMAHIPLNDDQWYCIEHHLKLPNPGTLNGISETWVNGVQTAGYYNWLSNQQGGTTDNPLTSMKYYKQNGDGTAYIDQFGVGTTRFNDCGGVVDPVPGPPAPPTGFGVN